MVVLTRWISFDRGYDHFLNEVGSDEWEDVDAFYDQETT